MPPSSWGWLVRLYNNQTCRFHSFLGWNQGRSMSPQPEYPGPQLIHLYGLRALYNGATIYRLKKTRGRGLYAAMGSHHPCRIKTFLPSPMLYSKPNELIGSPGWTDKYHTLVCHKDLKRKERHCSDFTQGNDFSDRFYHFLIAPGLPLSFENVIEGQVSKLW